MKTGDIKYVIALDHEYSYIYKVLIGEKHKEWDNHRIVKYIEKEFDFLNNKSIIGQEGTYFNNLIFDNLKEAINIIVSSKYGMTKEKLIKRLFK